MKKLKLQKQKSGNMRKDKTCIFFRREIQTNYLSLYDALQL